MSAAVAEQIQDAEAPAADYVTLGSKHELIARFLVGYSVHNVRDSRVDDEGWISILVATDDQGLTQDLLNVYNTLEDRQPRVRYELGRVDLMLVGSCEGHPIRLFSVARGEACDALRDKFPALGSEWMPVEIEALWAFVEEGS